MKAWRVCGDRFGEVVFADDEQGAVERFEYNHGEKPNEICRVPTLDGEPRERFSNLELQRAGFAVFCDRCEAADAIEHGIDEPDQWPLDVVGDEVVCDMCMTPREKLAAGGDPDDYTYADEYMDMPIGGLPHDAVPLADQ